MNPIVVNLFAGIGILVVAVMVLVVIGLSIIAHREKREAEIREIVESQIKAQVEVRTARVDLVEMKIDQALKRIDALAKRESDLWDNNSKMMLTVGQRIDHLSKVYETNLAEMLKDIAALKAEAV